MNGNEKSDLITLTFKHKHMRLWSSNKVYYLLITCYNFFIFLIFLKMVGYYLHFAVVLMNVSVARFSLIVKMWFFATFLGRCTTTYCNWTHIDYYIYYPPMCSIENIIALTSSFRCNKCKINTCRGKLLWKHSNISVRIFKLYSLRRKNFVRFQNMAQGVAWFLN